MVRFLHITGGALILGSLRVVDDKVLEIFGVYDNKYKTLGRNSRPEECTGETHSKR